MSAPLSNELFFEAHRGVTQSSVDKPLGVHWSANYDMANTFATHELNENDQTMYPMHTHGSLVSAQIPMSSVETAPKELNNYQITEHESEVPVKRGAPVYVTKIRTGGGAKRSRTRTYNPPREMKA